MKNKDAILEELRLSRMAIARDTHSLAEEFNISAKLQRSVKSHPLAWLSGAAAIGYIFAGPKTKTVTKVIAPKSESHSKSKDAPQKESSHLLKNAFGLFKILLPLIRPAISAYAARRLGEYAEKIGR